MYNGIGLQTPRGSGTNGYVQRNMSFVHKAKEKVNYKTEEDIKKLDALANRKPNQGILAHERKRTIELKCLEMQELMEEQGFPEDVINTKVSLFREMLLDKEGVGDKEVPKDEFGRPIVKESHQLAEANQEKNSKMRNALGISPFFVEGSSLDPERRNKEAAAAAAEEAKKKYTLIPDSSSSSSPERSQEKEKDKKRKKKKSPSTHEKEPSSKKKKSLKRRKSERSDSPDAQKKRKTKKVGKEKSKHKSKSDANRKKHARSSSSSSSSSSTDSADDESSSRSRSRDSNSDSASSQDKHKSASKHEKSHKLPRKRSTSSEKIRYAKDARSRKDIYEAKKAKYKKKPRSSSSSSSVESPPRQYYRLEPVLVKSKSKHKAPCQIFEIPKKSALELMKYERKKRKYQNSSSSSDKESSKGKQSSKRRKHSESPALSKSSKHSGRNQDMSSKQRDSHKPRRSEKGSLPEKRSQRSRSGGSGHRKSQNHKKSSHQEYSDSNQKMVKEHSNREDERHEKERNRKKQSRKETDSPKHQNGYSKHAVRSQTPETEDTDGRSRSRSPNKHMKYAPRSPSHSPEKYQHKKHVITSPSYLPPDSYKKKIPRSPSHSPPKKVASKHHRSRKSSSDSSPVKKSGRHDSESRSHSSTPLERDPRHKDRGIKVKKASVKESTRQHRSPPREREDSNSQSRSPSMHRSLHARPKHRSNNTDMSPSRNDNLDHDDHHTEKPHASRGWKSKGEIKEIRHRSKSSSPVHHKEHHSKQKKDRIYNDRSPSPKKANSPKAKPTMTVTVETCQITSTKSPVNSAFWNRDSGSNSPDRLPSIDELKRLKQNQDSSKQRTKDIVFKTSPIWSKDENHSPKNDRSKYSSAKSSSHTSSKPDHEIKSKQGSADANNISAVLDTDNQNDDSFSAKKNNWSVVSNGENDKDSASQGPSCTQSSETKMQSKSKRNESEIGSENVESSSKLEKVSARDSCVKKRRKKTPESNPSRSRSASENPDVEKSAKNKGRTQDVSRSRSRSTSLARSCSRSASERSSRSRSYSRRDSKSRSRSKSYSKSRSRSRSQSRSKSRSHSKSYSRSRSVSVYSRSRSRSYSSRSRSRSNARSPSIPRRRGSPSFLDKRRITSARKRPVPYRRPSPSTPSSASSWSYRSSPPFSRSSSPAHQQSPASRCSTRSPRSRSQSWSPVIRQKYEVALNTALR